MISVSLSSLFVISFLSVLVTISSLFPLSLFLFQLLSFPPFSLSSSVFFYLHLHPYPLLTPHFLTVISPFPYSYHSLSPFPPFSSLPFSLHSFPTLNFYPHSIRPLPVPKFLRPPSSGPQPTPANQGFTLGRWDSRCRKVRRAVHSRARTGGEHTYRGAAGVGRVERGHLSAAARWEDMELRGVRRGDAWVLWDGVMLRYLGWGDAWVIWG